MSLTEQSTMKASSTQAKQTLYIDVLSEEKVNSRRLQMRIITIT